MKCPDFHDRLQRRLDGDPGIADGDLERHRAECPHCRQLDAAAGRLEVGLRLLSVPAAASDLTDRIVAAVLADRRQRRSQRRRVLAYAGLAASLLLVAIGYAWVRSRSTPTPFPTAPPVLVQAPGIPQELKPAEGSRSLHDSMEEASSAVVSLTRRTAGDTVGQTRMLLPETVPAPFLAGADALPRDLVQGKPAQSLHEAGRGVSSGFEPVTTSARRAFDLFLNELPPMEPEQKRGL
jgi:hypothetical protein